MRVLLSGSSGLIGTALREHLLKRGDEVVCLMRREPDGQTQIHWDPSAGILDMDAVGPIDAAVHLGGKNIAGGRWTASEKKALRASRVNSTALLAQKLSEMDKPPSVFICASAVGIYGDRGAEVLDENSPMGIGFLAELGGEWEGATAIAQEHMRVVHARFGVVLSLRGGALAKMLFPFKLGLGGRLGSGQQYMSWIGLPDAVGALIHILTHQSMHGAVNIVAPDEVSNMDFTRALGRVLRRPTPFPVPAFVLRLALGEMADEALLASQRVQPMKLLRDNFAFQDPDLATALNRIFSQGEDKN